MPMKRSGRSVDEARRVIEIDEVLVPMIASGLRTGHSWGKILTLRSSFSAAVSITRSQSAMASRASAGAMRASASCRSLSLISFFEICRAMLPLMVARPDLMRSADTSLSRTGNPASAHTWAMPLPIWPAPMTPILRMLRFIPLVRIAAGGVLRRLGLRYHGARLAYRWSMIFSENRYPLFGIMLWAASLAELAEFGREFRQGLV